MKRLIVYYSRTGTTKNVGEAIAQALNADSDEIIDRKERLGGINYMRAARDAKGLKLTEIEVQKNPEDYDLIIIGTPIWWGNLTPAIRTYLKTYDLKRKKAAFFITSQDEDRESVFAQMSELIPESEIIGTFGILHKTVKNGGYTEQLNDFLKRLN